MYVIRVYPESAAEWDSEIAKTRGASLCQSFFWARVIERVDAAEPIFLTIQERDTSVGHLLLFYKQPFDRQLGQQISGISSLLRGLTGTLEWLGGPVIHRGDIAVEVINSVLEWAKDFVRTRNIGLIRSYGWVPTSTLAGSREMLDAFVGRGYKASRWGTFLVDLTVGEEDLWRKLAHAARKCVQKCEREGVKVRRITDFEDFSVNFYTPYATTQMAGGRNTNPLFVAKVMFEEDVERYYAYFVAEDTNGQVLGTLGTHIFNGIATEVSSALTGMAYENKIPAQDMLHWETMRYAKAQGCQTYDLAGVNPNPTNPKEVGVRRFKEKWGGRYVEYNRFHKTMGSQRIREKLRSVYGYIKRA